MTPHRKRTTIRSGMPTWNGEHIGEIIDITPLRYPLTYNLQDRGYIFPSDAPLTNFCTICGKPIYQGDLMIYRDIACPQHLWTHYGIQWQRWDENTDGPPLVERIEFPARAGFSHFIYRMLVSVCLRLMVLRWWQDRRRGSR